jgi:HK97 family phage portal protein
MPNPFSIIRAYRQAVERRMSISDFDSILDMIAGGGNPSYTGKLVGPKNALSITAFFSCVNILADDFATLPIKTYTWSKPGKYTDREEDREHYLWDLLLDEANPHMSAHRFKRIMEGWRNIWGNAFAEIEMNGRGQITALWPWHPDRTKVWLRDPNDIRSDVMYSYMPLNQNDKPFTVNQDRILHIRGTSIDGITGLSPVTVFRQQLAVQSAMTEFAGRFYGNGASIKGIVTMQGKLGTKAEISIRESMEKYRGLENAHRMMILEEGMTYVNNAMPLTDAQFLESMQFGGEDICRMFKVPQHRAGFHSASTNNNITQLAMEYVQYTLGPNAMNWIGEIKTSLLSQRERLSTFLEPDFDYLLSGDPVQRAELYSKLSQYGALSPDDVRYKEKLNTLPGGIGKTPRVPLNTAPLGSEMASGKQLNTVPGPRTLEKEESPGGGGNGNPGNPGKPNKKTNGHAAALNAFDRFDPRIEPEHRDLDYPNGI